MKFKDIIKIWKKSTEKSNTYITNWKNVGINVASKFPNIDCPVCFTIINGKLFSAFYDSKIVNGDIKSWECECPKCKANLIITND